MDITMTRVRKKLLIASDEEKSVQIHDFQSELNEW